MLNQLMGCSWMRLATILITGGIFAMFSAWLSRVHKGIINVDTFALEAVMWSVWATHGVNRWQSIAIAAVILGAVSISGGIVIDALESEMRAAAYVLVFFLGAAISGVALMIRNCELKALPPGEDVGEE